MEGRFICNKAVKECFKHKCHHDSYHSHGEGCDVGDCWRGRLKEVCCVEIKNNMQADLRCEFCGAKLAVTADRMISDCDCPLYPFITGKPTYIGEE